MEQEKHCGPRGSAFDDFLREEGIFEICDRAARARIAVFDGPCPYFEFEVESD